MEINFLRSFISFYDLTPRAEREFKVLLPFNVVDFNKGLKYLGFMLKPNYYGYQDWIWLYRKTEKRIQVGVLSDSLTLFRRKVYIPVGI
jgi:hypothetical protein